MQLTQSVVSVESDNPFLPVIQQYLKINTIRDPFLSVTFNASQISTLIPTLLAKDDDDTIEFYIFIAELLLLQLNFEQTLTKKQAGEYASSIKRLKKNTNKFKSKSSGEMDSSSDSALPSVLEAKKKKPTTERAFEPIIYSAENPREALDSLLLPLLQKLPAESTTPSLPQSASSQQQQLSSSASSSGGNDVFDYKFTNVKKKKLPAPLPIHTPPLETQPLIHSSSAPPADSSKGKCCTIL